MSATACPRCAAEKRPYFALCWKCQAADDVKAAYQRGFADGLRDAGPRLEPIRIRQLLQLAHPDRHGGSAAATDATQWLLAQRASLEATA